MKSYYNLKWSTLIFIEYRGGGIEIRKIVYNEIRRIVFFALEVCNNGRVGGGIAVTNLWLVTLI